jgi:hypothetical protein
MNLARLRRVGLAGLLLLLSTACGASSGGPVPPHTDLGGDPEALVSAFNADRGKVRAVFIASPT